MKAMILAAGLGTRLQPITENIPKALIPINGIPLLEHVISKLTSSGFDEIIINVHHHADQVINFLREKNNFCVKIIISDETDELLETGGGLKKASWFFNDNRPFLVYNVDIISDIDLQELYKFHISSDALVTLAVKNRKTTRYFLFDETNSLCGWKNLQTGEIKIVRSVKNKIKTIAFSGIHIIDPKIFNYLGDKIYFSLTDLYIEIARKQRIQAFNHDKTKWIDIGKLECLETAEKLFPKNKN